MASRTVVLPELFVPTRRVILPISWILNSEKDRKLLKRRFLSFIDCPSSFAVSSGRMDLVDMGTLDPVGYTEVFITFRVSSQHRRRNPTNFGEGLLRAIAAIGKMDSSYPIVRPFPFLIMIRSPLISSLALTHSHSRS